MDAYLDTDGGKRIPLDKILLVISERNLQKVFLDDGQMETIWCSLKSIEQCFRDYNIPAVLVNRSVLVGFAFMEGISGKGKVIFIDKILNGVNKAFRKELENIKVTPSGRKNYKAAKAACDRLRHAPVAEPVEAPIVPSTGSGTALTISVTWPQPVAIRYHYVKKENILLSSLRTLISSDSSS